MTDLRQGAIRFYFKRPHEISLNILNQIQELIEEGSAVGTAHIRENLQTAFLLSYALDQRGAVVGAVVLKHPKREYRKKIEEATGLNLSGYLERGYTSVRPGFRGQNIADRLIKGLIERSEGQKTYVTISMDNLPALKLTRKNGMIFAAQYLNVRTGHEVGVFVNR
jgi:GNAT superfamily N-acetyltransferase